MDELRNMMATIEARGFAQGNLRGLLHVLIGRRITKRDGQLVSNGLTWRDAAALLKRVRWDRNTVNEFGLVPGALPPRDRERFWYVAIGRAAVDSPEALAAGNRLAQQMEDADYIVGPPPPGK
jgi:hypothetical protein